MIEQKLPSLGEGVEKGIIVSILVKVGDEVSLDQPLMELETDKVTVEIPAEQEGIVSAIYVSLGDEIPEGTLLVKIENEEEAPISQTLAESIQKNRELKEQIENQILDNLSDGLRNEMVIDRDIQATRKHFRASPLARKIAREIGIDVSNIKPSRPSGRISVKDVKDFAKALNQGRSNTPATPAPVSLPNFEKWGEIRRESMSRIMQASSRNMSQAWSQIPHAWLQEKADITELDKKRKAYKNDPSLQGANLTITAILVKVLAKALEKFPLFNASLDSARQEVIYKDYIHVGVAVDTERGLVVPKIEHANTKSLSQIAIDLADISKKARDKKLKASDLEGTTFSISNLGGIGTSSIFPIVNFPEVAILGIASSKIEGIWDRESFQPRLLMPMTLGFDHRIINGADAARFLQELKALLEDWFLWSL